jgi:DNA-binding response OmpR family regulator
MNAARILVVEDDESIQLITRLSLETLGGFDVTVCSSGEEALAVAPQLDLDLLVLDVSMPGLDGPQTLKLMRQLPELARTRAVFLTASTQAGQVAAYRELGALDVIAKPFDPQHLCERVRAVLAMPLDRPAAEGPAATSGARRALVVEDDPGVRYLLRFILEQQGWAVAEAETGHAGMRHVHQGEPADIVLLDIMLPEVDGLEILDALRASPRWRAVPVMMLTARGDEASVKRALASGANDYLAKPFDPAELAARVQRLTSSSRAA